MQASAKIFFRKNPPVRPSEKLFGLAREILDLQWFFESQTVLSWVVGSKIRILCKSDKETIFSCCNLVTMAF